MSRKYISQINDNDFVYPNNEISEYGVEIVHDINDNCVSGTVNSFSVSAVSPSEIQLNYDLTWNLNGAEPWIRNSNLLGVWSIHMLAPGQDYYKPWRVVDNRTTATLTATTYNESVSVNVTASSVGLATFETGTYYFEVRFIGHRCIYPVCVNVEYVEPTPTPTITPTFTPTPTPTPTITPTVGDPTPTPTITPTITPPSEGISLQVYGRDIDGSPATLTFFYSINGGGNVNVPGYTGAPLPTDCTLLYTITGLTATDTVLFGTSIACVMTGTSGISSCPASISGSLTTYTYIVDAPSIQAVSLTIDSGTIP